MQSMNRIDNLTPGTYVILEFGNRADEAQFLRMESVGQNRRACFQSKDPDGRTYEWEAYRYMGRWAWGTGAGRLSLVETIDNPLARR